MSPGVMEASSSSKVTVEYHDPAGVFPLVSREIAARLPLRGLNWQSPSRPLRQIRQLYVEFVPDNLTGVALRPPVQRFDSNGPTSLEIVRGGKDGRNEAVKERRHQIPGLKTSPYLKIYVLRCDDKDQYKDRERKNIREWIRENAQKQDKRGEDHDAFEWLILHVVIPDTIAASEPRWRGSQSEPDTLKERKTSNVKFPGKSTRTVFDRLRADFNESGKGAQDRVAQLRLAKSDVPPDLLPTPAVAETLAETPQERENAWKDLMDKFKTLILGSFDARVRQYELDVAAQESRRSVPGWNFCTFFIHKEGLAKALESVGLAEDALVIYDELSLGLETVLRDLASGQAEGTATTFASHTDDLEARLLGKAKQPANNDVDTEAQSSEAAGLFAKDYREQIVRSNISVFDFFCYLFTRQKAIILRLANTKAARAELGGDIKDGGEDLVLTSEVCWRASNFIHNNARTLRQDLTNSPKPRSPVDIEALVASWIYAVADLVLSETAAPVLDLVQSNDTATKPLYNGIFGPKREDFSFGMGANPYPQRTSSLGMRKSAPELQRPASIATGSTISPPSEPEPTVPNGAGIPGLPELATYRAELVMMQRKMLEQLGAQHGWYAGWASMRRAQGKHLDEININGEQLEINYNSHNASNLVCPTLIPALESEIAFRDKYIRLSEKAMRYYALATQSKPVDSIICDIAMLKYEQDDYDSTEQYLKHLLPNFGTLGYSAMQTDVLYMYALCLNKLGRWKDYIKTGLQLLAEVCGKRMARTSFCTNARRALEDEQFHVSGMLPELVSLSHHLEKEILRSADHYFSDINIDLDITHLEGMDGFALHLHFGHVLDDVFDLEEVRARLVNVDDPTQEIWLTTVRSSTVKPGGNDVELKSLTVTLGAFLVDKILFKAGNLCFTYELRSKLNLDLRANEIQRSDLLTSQAQPLKPSLVFLYPSEDSFNAELSLAKGIHVDRFRFFEIILSSGRNDITSLKLRFKPMTAGLRLHLADTHCEGVERLDDENEEPGTLALGSLVANQIYVVKVPYSLEQTIKDVSVRLQARYLTATGTFNFLSSSTLRHELPLDVDVDDIFHQDTLFSNFTIRTTNQSPLMILETELVDSPVYDVRSPPSLGDDMMVFDKSPAKLLYQITRKSAGIAVTKKDAALALGVHYLSIDELVCATVQRKFAADLQRSKLQPLSRLLLPLVADRSRQICDSVSTEIAVILNDIRTPSYDAFGWDEVVRTLPKAVQHTLTGWLKKWHNDNPRLPLDFRGEIADVVSRRITIAVDVPTIDVVFNASLGFPKQEHCIRPGSYILTWGKPISTQLAITHTDKWSSGLIFGRNQTSAKQEDVFVCEIQADPDIWHIGGMRRMHFKIKPGSKHYIDLVLIPLKLGNHLLPSVEIQSVQIANTEGSNNPVHAPSTSCETHYLSGGQKVQVIRDVHTTDAHVVDFPDVVALPSSRPSTASKVVTEPG